MNVDIGPEDPLKQKLKFLDRVVKKIQIFMEEMENMIELLLGSDEEDQPEDDSGISNLMYKLKNYFRSMRQKKLGSTKETLI